MHQAPSLMKYRETTQVPNILFDRYFPILSESELRVLLVIIRQTYGWVDRKTGGRKMKDRISHSQFMQKSGLSRRSISKAVNSLVGRRLIGVSDVKGMPLEQAHKRKGSSGLTYSILPPSQEHPPSRFNGVKHIQDILRSRDYEVRRRDP